MLLQRAIVPAGVSLYQMNAKLLYSCNHTSRDGRCVYNFYWIKSIKNKMFFKCKTKYKQCMNVTAWSQTFTFNSERLKIELLPHPSLNVSLCQFLYQAAVFSLSSLWCSDVCYSTDLPEFEIISLLEEQLPVYRLRADTVYGYDHDDWLHTPLVAPDARLDLTTEQIEETLKYFCKFGSDGNTYSVYIAISSDAWCSWGSVRELFSRLISNSDGGHVVKRNGWGGTQQI